MQRVSIGTDDLEPITENVFEPLSDDLDTAGVAINYYERLPGESIGFCYHRHLEQEEVFVVLAGTVTFETENGSVQVGPDEVIRFAPGEWQQGFNHGDVPVAVLAIGAPREAGPTELRRECPDCGRRRDVTETLEDDELVFYCQACGADTGREGF